MKKCILYFVTYLLLISCNNKRVLQLPQINESTPIKMTDHSPIYIFFNPETQTSELNRTNLITSTHWIFHVDKRNSLYEAVFQIDKMQTRKENPMNPHNNPNSRNYFSVADMSQKQLGFVDFTSTRFLVITDDKPLKKTENDIEISVDTTNFYINNEKINISNFVFDETKNYFWIFSGKMSFQEFMTIYHNLLKMNIIPKKISCTKN